MESKLSFSVLLPGNFAVVHHDATEALSSYESWTCFWRILLSVSANWSYKAYYYKNFSIYNKLLLKEVGYVTSGRYDLSYYRIKYTPISSPCNGTTFLIIIATIKRLYCDKWSP